MVDCQGCNMDQSREATYPSYYVSVLHVIQKPPSRLTSGCQFVRPTATLSLPGCIYVVLEGSGVDHVGGEQ